VSTNSRHFPVMSGVYNPHKGHTKVGRRTI